MDNNKALNEFVAAYYGQLADAVYANPVKISKEETALIIIDAQKCVKKEYFVEGYKAMGVDVEPLMPVLDQLEENTDAALANIEKILNKCREVGIRPIHIRIQSLLPDGKDTGRLHASAGMCYPPGGFASEFCEEASPLEGEIVLDKTCSGIVVGTPIDRILRNLGIKSVIVTGFYTDQCVSTSVRDLSDTGYEVDMIEDAMMAMSLERHEKALQSTKHIYANCEKTEQLLKRLETLK
ncbi:MAG: isochorismatase family cysteine hydrolase [Emergencia sp.]|nr:isochorismatase family cysteine hydrolase [Emergencia sp.]